MKKQSGKMSFFPIRNRVLVNNRRWMNRARRYAAGGWAKFGWIARMRMSIYGNAEALNIPKENGAHFFVLETMSRLCLLSVYAQHMCIHEGESQYMASKNDSAHSTQAKIVAT